MAAGSEGLRLQIIMDFTTNWYSFWKKPQTLHEKYDHYYWFNFYIYQDLRQLSKLKNDKARTTKIDHAYYSGNWDELNKI